MWLKEGRSKKTATRHTQVLPHGYHNGSGLPQGGGAKTTSPSVGATKRWQPACQSPVHQDAERQLSVAQIDPALGASWVGRSGMPRWASHGRAQVLMQTARNQSIYKFTNLQFLRATKHTGILHTVLLRRMLISSVFSHQSRTGWYYRLPPGSAVSRIIGEYLSNRRTVGR